MFSTMSCARIAGVWFVAVGIAFACSRALGMALTVGAGELWAVACLIPPAVLLVVRPAAPPLTVAEVLHSVHTPPHTR